MVDQLRLPPPAELALPIGEAMFTLRAIRKFKPDPIGDEQLELIMNAASRAPSGGNFQPARFLVIRDRARIRAFGELYREAWWAKRREGPGWTRVEDIPKSEKTFLAAAQLADEMGRVPVVVLAFSVVRGDLGHSVLPAVQNLLLSARALGIGSTLTTLHDDVMPRVLEMFDVPDSAQFYCSIPLGYPRGRFGTTLRRPSSETTYWDAWMQPPPWR
ncbi:MAG: nitroreductase family protein [Deltaproteobacteria bacterium]|nr:nitroreductase family protein [Deltaproteobacteria bacterium]